MVTMATMTIADEVKVKDHDEEQDLRPHRFSCYNTRVDIIREREYPMLKGTTAAS